MGNLKQIVKNEMNDNGNICRLEGKECIMRDLH